MEWNNFEMMNIWNSYNYWNPGIKIVVISKAISFRYVKLGDGQTVNLVSSKKAFSKS